MAEPWTNGKGLIINMLTGAVDIVPAKVVDYVKSTIHEYTDETTPPFSFLHERGYYVESAEVEDIFARALAKHRLLQAQRTAEPKYMFFSTLRCNLTCSYCWQVLEHGADRQRTAIMTDKMIEAAFRYIDIDLKRRRMLTGTVSLFGGEPLIDRADSRAALRSICEQARQRHLHLHFTTNGKNLARYRNEVETFRPSIQVTVDGFHLDGNAPTLSRAQQRLPGLHEELRYLASRGLFQLYVRFLVSCDTIDQFVSYADEVHSDEAFSSSFVLGVAPIQNKSSTISMDVSPKFEILTTLLNALHGRTYTSRLAFTDWRSLYLFNYMRMGENLLPPANFYHCEAQTHLLCFGSDGLLYTCYEACGDTQFAVGQYFSEADPNVPPTDSNPELSYRGPCSYFHVDPQQPQAVPDIARGSASIDSDLSSVKFDDEHLNQFRARTAFSIPQCSQCAMSPICGGGCQVKAMKKYGSNTLPYCDHLHEEVRQTMRNWEEISRMLLPIQSVAEE